MYSAGRDSSWDCAWENDPMKNPALKTLMMAVFPVISVFAQSPLPLEMISAGNDSIEPRDHTAPVACSMHSRSFRVPDSERMQSELSTLWTAVTLNMIAADVLSLYIPASREEFTDFADGKEADLMLAGAVFY